MNRFYSFALAIVALLLLAAGCRGKQSIASKSATAYREAVTKGIPVSAGGHEHGGQHEEQAGSPMPGMQHGAMAGMEHSQMQHGSMQGMKNMRGMQHGSMAGMDHSQMQHGSMQGMQNMPGMQHGAPGPSVVIAAPSTSSGIAQLSPRSTLQSDEFDRPAPPPPTEKEQP